MEKTYAIFGAGLSGQAARRLAQSLGFAVVLFDEAGKGDRTTFAECDLSEFDCFILSPGFAVQHPWRLLAEASGKPCLSELAFAARHWQGRIIGITGTNGKSTLTALIEKAFLQSGQACVAAGNIGYPFADAVLLESNHTESWAVLEISSFQAELPSGLHLDALVWSNFAEDHLDRYPSMAAYFNAKARLIDCLNPDGVCVVGRSVAGWMQELGKSFDHSVLVAEEDTIIMQLTVDSVFRRAPYSENLSLAAALWRLLGYPSGPLLAAANEFGLAAHRLDVVAEWGGVRFWNDSKATNFHAALAALESLRRPIVWIGGGRSKGGDVEAFAQKVAGFIDAAILYGEVAPRLAVAFADSSAQFCVHDRFEDAIFEAAAIAAKLPNSNVLLSPGFASFDQFTSYAARGKSFTDTVLSLKNTNEVS